MTTKSDILRLKKALKGAEKEQEERKEKKKPPISARTGLALLGWNPKTAEEYAIEFFSIDKYYGKQAELVSFEALEWAAEDKPNHFFSTDQRGLFVVYEDVKKSVQSKIKLSTTVTGIKYNTSVMEVIRHMNE